MAASAQRGNGRHLVKVSRPGFPGSPQSPQGPCCANAVPGGMWEQRKIKLRGRKAPGTSTDTTGPSSQQTAFGQTGSPKIPCVPPRSLGTMPCKCRPGRCAGMARNLAPGPVSLSVQKQQDHQWIRTSVEVTDGISPKWVAGDSSCPPNATGDYAVQMLPWKTYEYSE